MIEAKCRELGEMEKQLREKAAKVEELRNEAGALQQQVDGISGVLKRFLKTLAQVYFWLAANFDEAAYPKALGFSATPLPDGSLELTFLDCLAGARPSTAVYTAEEVRQIKVAASLQPSCPGLAEWTKGGGAASADWLI